MSDSRFASRAGEKLQYAIEKFNISVKGKIVADFGSSTGGFVDCLLQNGAAKVYSIDTAYGELAWKLRNDQKVVLMERTNAMHVSLPERVDLVTVDVGWTKQRNILPNVFANLNKEGVVISLVKPHYEADKRFLRGGRLLEGHLDEAINNVKKDVEGVGGEVLSLVESPIIGEKGKNREFLFLIKRK